MLIASAIGGCSSIGPNTVARDRIDYGTAIGESWKQQTLLNIVKLRYGDFPIFLEIAQVVAGYQIESGVSAGFNASNSSGSVIGPFAYGGSALATGKYTDRPTLIYSPLTGTDFLKKLMTPLPPANLLFMLQSGYPADFLMPVVVNSVNGLGNESRRGMAQAGDPKFARVAQLLRELQLADALQVRVERPNTSAEAVLIVFPPASSPERGEKLQELSSLLRLAPGSREFSVRYGGYSGSSNEIAIMTRSMLQIMIELSAAVAVPASHVATGKATPGAVDAQGAATQAPALITISSGDAPPREALVAVQYGDLWFWISNTDYRSKATFALVMMLFAMAETGIKSTAPVLTVPAN